MDKNNLVFDKEDALERVDGDVLFIAELIRDFLQSFPSKLSILSELISQGNAKLVEKEAHSIKGALRNLAAVKSGNIAYQLELAGRNGDLAQMATLLEALNQGVKEFELATESLTNNPA